MWPAAHTQSKASPFEMNAVNHNGAWAAQMQSPCAAAYRAVPAARAMILAHMAMNGGKCNRAAGMRQRQRQAVKAWQGKTRPL